MKKWPFYLKLLKMGPYNWGAHCLDPSLGVGLTEETNPALPVSIKNIHACSSSIITANDLHKKCFLGKNCFSRYLEIGGPGPL